MNETKSVFISYKSEEFDEANWIKTTLEHNGISCWMAPSSIQGGSSYATEIPKAIRECKVFVLLLSEKSQASKWVPRELDQAINEGKIIMPFMIEQCGLKDDFNFYLTNVQRYEAYKNKAAAIEKMIKEIRAVLKAYEKTEKDEGKQEEKVEPQKKETQEKKEEVKKEEIKKETVIKQKKAKAEKPDMKKIIGIAAVAVFVLILGSFLWNSSQKLTIAGKKVSVHETYFYLSDAELTKEDMENLAKLEEATSLSFTNCVFPSENLGAICNEKMGMLRFVNCSLTDAHIASIDFETMDSLRELSLEGNTLISNLDGISTLSDTMTILNISGTAVDQLDFLKEFTKLRLFYAENNQIADISALKNCTELRELYLDGNQITSLESLGHYSELRKVSVSNNQLTSLKGLENHIQLTQISAGNNQLTSLEGLENATLLTEVYLSGNQIADITLLGKSAATLQKLYLNNNQVSDLSVLENCTVLQCFSADNNQITSIEKLANCVALQQISLASNELTSLDGLASCVNLEYLNVSDNKLEKIAALGDISYSASKALTMNLSNNNISELILPQGVDWNFLDLHGNPISNLDALEKSTGVKIALDYSEASDYEKLAAADFSTYYILGCPLDKQISVGETVDSYRTEFVEAAEVNDKFEMYIPYVIKK